MIRGGLPMKNRLFLLLLLLMPHLGAAEDEPLDLELDSSTIYRGDSKGSSWLYNKNYWPSEHKFENECRWMAAQIRDIYVERRRRLAIQRRYELQCLDDLEED
jgi:hypothetical protein